MSCVYTRRNGRERPSTERVSLRLCTIRIGTPCLAAIRMIIPPKW